MKKTLILFTSVFLLACSGSTHSGSTHFGAQHSVGLMNQGLSEAEMIAKVQKLISPGEGHQNLQPLVGNWKATSRFWLNPQGTPEESVATVSRNWILDGRFIQEVYVDKNPNYPLEGIGLLGYDNVRQTYISNWVDTMTTGVTSSIGTASPSGEFISFVGEQACPITGAVLQTRSELSIVDNDRNLLEMYQTNIAGVENKILEILYERREDMQNKSS